MKRSELVAGKTYAYLTTDEGLHRATVVRVVDTEAKYRKEDYWRDPKGYCESVLFRDANAVLVESVNGTNRRLVRLQDLRQEWTIEEAEAYRKDYEERQARILEAERADYERNKELFKQFQQVASAAGIEGSLYQGYSRIGRRTIELSTNQLEQLVNALTKASV